MLKPSTSKGKKNKSWFVYIIDVFMYVWLGGCVCFEMLFKPLVLRIWWSCEMVNHKWCHLSAHHGLTMTGHTCWHNTEQTTYHICRHNTEWTLTYHTYRHDTERTMIDHNYQIDRMWRGRVITKQNRTTSIRCCTLLDTLMKISEHIWTCLECCDDDLSN